MIDEKERVKQRKKRIRQEKRKKLFQWILIIISFFIIGLASFVVTMKLCNPDFKINSLVDKKNISAAVENVKRLSGKNDTTNSQPSSTTKPTTKPTTKQTMYDYDSFDEFAFNTSLQGNQVGNLLNKTNGTVTYSSAYIYYYISGDGIYKFEPNDEINSKIFEIKDDVGYLNVLGDYLYYVNKDKNTLNRITISGKNDTQLATGISFSYLYNNQIYYVGNDNTIGVYSVNDNKKNMLYAGFNGMKLKFVGVSFSKLFFTALNEEANTCHYYCVDFNKPDEPIYFMKSTQTNHHKNLQLENGFFYYYEKQEDSSYSLIRQKFGSDKAVELLKNCSNTDYPVIYRNRLYYTAYKNGKIQARELNMNSMDDKLMVNGGKCDSSNTFGIGYGFQYIFLIGKASEQGNMVYKSSCIYTSASSDNTLSFEKGKWQY